MTAGPKYVSRSDEKLQANEFYSYLEPVIQELFIQGSNINLEKLDNIYSAKRASTASPTALAALKSRVPSDIAPFAEHQGDLPPQFGASELDLIDFLLRYKNNRVLCIVGTVGIGKTTYLRHVFFRMPAKCPSLRAFVPIMVDCLKVCAKTLDYGDLLYAVISAIRDACTSDDGRAYLLRESSNLFGRYDFVSTSTPASATEASFLAFFREFCAICGTGLQPVLIFDNLDQCLPSIVTSLREIGRAVFLDSGIFVLLAMRPPTYRTHIEKAHERGSFYRYAIPLDPPDLPTVIEQRLTHVVALTEDKPGQAELVNHDRIRVVTLADPIRSLRTLVNRLLVPDVQAEFLRGICNNDVRKALSAFAYFLSFRALEYGLLFPVHPEPAAVALHTSKAVSEPHRGWYRHLLEGLLIGPRSFYDRRFSPIANILVLDESMYEIDYVILYRALTLVASAARYISTAEVLSWMEEIGYHTKFSELALQTLLSLKLIYSPEDELKIEETENIRASESGIYYVERLVEHPQYLYHVVFDLRLAHDLWTREQTDTFPVHLDSILELLKAIVPSEGAQIAHILAAEPPSVEILGCLRRYGLLSQRLLAAAESLLSDADHTRFPKAFQAASDFRAHVAPLKEQVRAMHQQIHEALLQYNLMSNQGGKSRTRRQQIRQKEGQILRMDVPLELSPSYENKVHFEAHLAGLEPDDMMPIVLHWTGTPNGVEFSELIPLRRDRSKPIYKGDLTIPVTQVTAFPSCRVTLLSGSEALLIDEMPAVA